MDVSAPKFFPFVPQVPECDACSFGCAYCHGNMYALLSHETTSRHYCMVKAACSRQRLVHTLPRLIFPELDTCTLHACRRT